MCGLSGSWLGVVVVVVVAIIYLTRPDGVETYVQPDAILRIEPSNPRVDGIANAKSRITGHSGSFWVRESPEEVLRRLRETN